MEAEGKRAGEHRHGTCHEDQHGGDQQPLRRDPDELAREAQQAEHDEHHHLCDPREAVVQEQRPALEDQARVAQHDPAQVDRQEAASPEHGGDPVGQQPADRREDRVEPDRFELDPVDERDGPAAHQETGHRPPAQLPREEPDEAGSRFGGAEDELDEGDRQQDGHRVVGAALDLEGGGEAPPEVQSPGAQDEEDRRRVGGPDDAAEE